jgi:hypothetical protein
MKHLNNNSSAATCRAPFAPATQLEHVPIVFYEILNLATKSGQSEIATLIKSVIAVTQSDPESLLKLPHVASLIAESVARGENLELSA